MPVSASMTSAERRTSIAMAGVFGLRMLGLFLILPVFSAHAPTLSGGQNAALVGLALGVYGLVQALFQLPFGIASDRWGRKPVILFGLALFALGALIATLSTSIEGVILGRAIQGGGAISAAVTALVADATRDSQRTKAMAMVGAAIASSYALAMVAAPLLYQGVGMAGIFALTGILALLAMAVVKFLVPEAPLQRVTRVPLRAVLRDGQLMRLNVGVFALHMGQLAMFLVLPAALIQALDMPLASHWKLYLPVVLASFVLMLPPIYISERHGKVKQVFLAAITLLLMVQLAFAYFFTYSMRSGSGANTGTGVILVSLLLAFFVAFNILEASQPSLVSRLAPPDAKGTALGVYNTLQSLGLFIGGALGGWIQQQAGIAAVFVFSAILTACWLIIAASMRQPLRRGEAVSPAHIET